MSELNILFDTHAWLWFVAGDIKIDPKIITLVEKSREMNSLYLSSISLWETSMLIKKERVNVNQPTLSWIKSAIKTSNIHLIHITPEIAYESTELPNNFHGDPADRIIVATARVMDLIILTRDHKILDYSKNKFVQTVAI